MSQFVIRVFIASCLYQFDVSLNGRIILGSIPWGGVNLEKTSEPFNGYYTIPKLLERNAKIYSTNPAYREKEYGIWQTWTWAQSFEEVTALANGLIELGLKEGDNVAIVGRNRPALYWSFIAAQMAGAVPVPVYNDAVGLSLIHI